MGQPVLHESRHGLRLPRLFMSKSGGLEKAMKMHCDFCATPPFALPGAAVQQGFRERAALLNAAFWGRGVRLTVAFVEGPPELHRRVAELAAGWVSETRADFSFEFWFEGAGAAWKPEDAAIRVAFAPGKGSWSALGKYALQTPRSQPTMNLGWMSLDLGLDEARAVVLHEFGHALGLIHEHMNPSQPIDWNVDEVSSDLRQSQGWDNQTIYDNMFARYDPSQVFATDLDTASIMMYPIPSRWTISGRYTSGFNTMLTAQDKALIREAYGVRAVFGGG